MRLLRIPTFLFLTSSLVLGFRAQAQLGGLIQKAKEKAGRLIEKKVDKDADVGKSKDRREDRNSHASFIIGDSLIFSENFSMYKIGGTAGSFKTNGAAVIARPTGQPGKWLVLQENASYKLQRTGSLPKNIIFEFDILCQAEQIRYLSPISFGFVKDNAVGEYISNGGAFVQLHYYDEDAVNIGNYDLNKEANTKFDLSATANRILHVKVVTNGDRMTVYLDNTILAETILFHSQAARYFYISGPNRTENGAKLFASNFRIKRYSK